MYNIKINSSTGGGRCGTLLLLLILAVVEQNRQQKGITQIPLSIYSTLQNSRNLLIQSKLAIPGTWLQTVLTPFFRI